MIELTTERIDDLFEATCDRVRNSVRQSRESILNVSRQRLANDSRDFAAVHVLAASSLIRRNPSESLRILQLHDQSFEENALGNRLAGYAWLLKNDLDQAHHHFDRAVRLDPHLTDCWNLLGKIAEGRDQQEDAAAYYRRALVFEHADAESAIALSKIQAKQSRVRDAIHTLRICLLRDQRSPKLNLALARLLERRTITLSKQRYYKRAQRLHEETLDCYRRVNAAAPTCKSWVAQGLLEQRIERMSDAKRSFERALELDPRSSIALSSLAAANVDLGSLEEAAGQFESSFAIDPTRGISHFRYTRAKKFKAGRDTTRYIEQLKELLRSKSLPRRQRLHLHFAIGKVLDDLGEHDEAWAQFDRGNRLNPGHSSRVASKAATALTRNARESEEFFSREWFERRRSMGNQDATPILIVGMPRSGTTLCEQILSSHSMVAGAGELNDWNRIRHEISREHGVSNEDAQSCETSDSTRGALARGLLTTTEADLQRLAKEYLERLHQFRTDERHVTDKMPTNFMLLGLVATLFPNATILHCRRNPMDVLASCYSQNLSAPFCDLEQLVEYHRLYRRMMRHWEQVLPMRIHTVDYEAMVSDPATETRTLISHCGLDWEQTCLEFQSNSRVVHTPSKWQVRQPMYRSSVEKWRRFEKQLAPVAATIEAEIAAENWYGEHRTR